MKKLAKEVFQDLRKDIQNFWSKNWPDMLGILGGCFIFWIIVEALKRFYRW